MAMPAVLNEQQVCECRADYLTGQFSIRELAATFASQRPGCSVYSMHEIGPGSWLMARLKLWQKCGRNDDLNNNQRRLKMTEVKYDKSHHAGATPEARIANRLRNSGEGSKPNVHTQQGTGPLRAHHNINHSGHYVDPSTAAKETGPQEQAHAADAARQQTTSYTPQDTD